MTSQRIRSEPINPNESWAAEHTVYIAETGGGKGSMIRGNPDIPKPENGGRIVCWDRAAAYPGFFYREWNRFVDAYARALDSDCGFSIGYTGDDIKSKIEAHERWAGLVWNTADGSKRTYVIDEEQGGVHETVGKAKGYALEIMNEGRKWGLVWHGTAQRPQEIPKSIISQSKFKYFGAVDECDLDYMKKWLSDPDILLDLAPGEFLRKHRRDIKRGRYPEVFIKRKEKNGVIQVT